MNVQQYQQVCRACDEVLLAPDATIECVAIPWLHVIREHPVFLQRYEPLFDDSIEGKATGFLLATRRWLVWLRQITRSMRNLGSLWSSSRSLPGHCDVLFISRILNKSQAGRRDDFYFGSMPVDVAEAGLDVVIGLANSTNISPRKLLKKWPSTRVQRVAFSNALGLVQELNLLVRSRREMHRLKRSARSEQRKFQRKVLNRAGEEALTCDSALRLAAQVGALAKRLRPKAVILTYEGHAWERMVFKSVSDACEDTKRIAYQHAIIFPRQHAIRRALTPEFNPDVVLTAGRISQSVLSSLANTPVAVLGSHRRLEISTLLQNSTKNKVMSCLVIPEGIPEECDLLFEFSLECARLNPRLQFVWRLHPLLNFESVVGSNEKLASLPSNIDLSERSLEEDLQACGWVIYRGSTAIIQAVLSGVRPIYFKVRDQMDIDPLSTLGEWRLEAENSHDIRRLIQDDLVQDQESRRNAVERAKEYCDGLFAEPNIEVLLDAV